jgi:ATP-dependent DNA helicase RecG
MPQKDTLLKNLSRITPSYAKLLEKINLKTVEDLLFYFPFRYDDFSKITDISEEFLGQNITVEGKITKIKNTRIFKRRMTITEIIIQNENNIPLKAIWFNQPFILNSLKENMLVRLAGKLELNGKFLSMANPAWERAARDATNTGRLVPIYNETKGLTSKWLRWQIKSLLPFARDFPEVIPKSIYEKFNLYSTPKALAEIHFPTSKNNLLRAEKSFAFREMFLVQLKALEIKNNWDRKKSLIIKFDEDLIKKFVASLPFKLTNAQRKASFEILKDLEKNRPMNRLLNGDVGSGKTIVAAASALQTIKAGYQVALMAPTEVLARQHFFSFCELFKDYGINIALLTNSYREINNFQFSIFPARSGSRQGGGNFQSIFNDKILKNKKNIREYLLKNVFDGKINLIIGTHALIQKDVSFKNLALVIIDEQHRFGVNQRATLQQETMNIKDGVIKTIPHLLTMTATPIPRSLAIAFFGSLDLSILDEMPKNRKPIITKIIPPALREKTYQFIRQEIQKGRQCFIILPLVEESKVLTEVKAAVAEHKRLSEVIFPDLKLGLVHGRLKAKDKEKAMKEFENKKLDILVATAVIEVGIDIPNASVMIIEDAERFGLSQLHQFRGRIGRGMHQSYCFLFTPLEKNRTSNNQIKLAKQQKIANKTGKNNTFLTGFTNSNTKTARERLETLEKTNDGFKIAERDLELRGPGQFFGTIQSGLPDIAMENIANVKLIKFARAEAQELLKSDPALSNHPEIKNALQKFQEKVHLE